MNWLALILLLLGAAAVVFGVWLILPAAGYITAGVLLAAAGVLTLDVRGKEPDQ